MLYDLRNDKPREERTGCYWRYKTSGQSAWDYQWEQQDLMATERSELEGSKGREASLVTGEGRSSAATPRAAPCTVPRRKIEAVKNYENYQICWESEPWRHPPP